MASTDLSLLITLYYQGFSPTTKKDHLAMALLHNSLYFPGPLLDLCSNSLLFLVVIVHWIHVLGIENVIVMQTELLHLSDKNIRGGGKKENIRAVVREQLNFVHRSASS